MAHIERGRDEVQRQEHGEEESADHTDAAAGPDFIADAAPERHRQHADHTRDRGHEDRTEFLLRSLKHRVMHFHPRSMQRGGFVHDQDRVVDHDADHHDAAEHADHGEQRAREIEHREEAHESERNGEHDEEGTAQGLHDGCDHQERQEDRRDQDHDEVHGALVHHFGLAGEDQLIAHRKPRGKFFPQETRQVVHGIAGRGVCVNPRGPFLILSHQADRDG